MKRPRTDDETDPSAGERNGDHRSVDVQMVNGDQIVKESSHQVVVVGAGPGGLMLACVV
jgi:NADPH-dependent 2,4-dienoyl-CoA reductase/sulfur reductase-like enzyme